MVLLSRIILNIKKRKEQNRIEYEGFSVKKLTYILLIKQKIKKTNSKEKGPVSGFVGHKPLPSLESIIYRNH